jgi:hypothetical protein
MNDTDTNVQFDANRAQRYAPLEVLKIGIVVQKDDPNELTTIEASWGETQTFRGTYVQVLDPNTGAVKHGSGIDEWMDTHARWEGMENGWYKTTPVDAYQATEAGVIITTLANGQEEGRKAVNVGDWIVRQNNGEVMCISEDKFPTLYNANNPTVTPRV